MSFSFLATDRSCMFSIGQVLVFISQDLSQFGVFVYLRQSITAISVDRGNLDYWEK